MDYPKFIAQKYKTELAEALELIRNFCSVSGEYNRVMHMYKCNVALTEIPDVLFSNCKLLFKVIWRIVANIKSFSGKQNYDEYTVIKMAEALDLVLNGYKLTEQECAVICNVDALPKNSKTEKFIADARIAHIGNYIRRQLLPYWYDKLSPECIEYVTAEIEKNIKDTNEFIAKEDLLNTIYFVNPRPENWREQLTAAAIPFDD